MPTSSKPQPLLVAPPPIEILKSIKAFAPQVGRITLAAGTIVGMATLAEQAEQALEDAVKKGLKRKVKRKKSDNRQVIKVSDAIDCVEKHVWDAKNLVTTAKSLVNLVTGGDVSTIANVIVQASVDCIRNKALQQKNGRSFGLYKKTKGPGIPKDKTYSEFVNLRRGKLHPFIPK